MAAAGGRCAGRKGLRYSAGVGSHALERQRRPPASVTRSVNGEARLPKGRGAERRGGKKHSSPYRFLLLLHPGGHLGHGPVDGDAVVEIRHVLAAVDRQRFGGVQRPRSEGEFTHCLPASQEQPGRRRRGAGGGGRANPSPGIRWDPPGLCLVLLRPAKLAPGRGGLGSEEVW